MCLERGPEPIGSGETPQVDIHPGPLVVDALAAILAGVLLDVAFRRLRAPERS